MQNIQVCLLEVQYSTASSSQCTNDEDGAHYIESITGMNISKEYIHSRAFDETPCLQIGLESFNFSVYPSFQLVEDIARLDRLHVRREFSSLKPRFPQRPCSSSFIARCHSLHVVVGFLSSVSISPFCAMEKDASSSSFSRRMARIHSS